MYSGLSKPKAAFIWAMTSGEASGGISMSIGLPGTMCTSPKTTRETPSRMGMAWSRRRRAKRSMRSGFSVWLTASAGVCCDAAISIKS